MYKIVHRMNDSLVGIALLTPPTECDIVLIMETKVCENCKRPVPLYAYLMHLEVCKRFYVKPLYEKFKQRGTRVSPDIKPHSRRCRICDALCWPNYFFCKACQSSAKDRTWDSWGITI